MKSAQHFFIKLFLWVVGPRLWPQLGPLPTLTVPDGGGRYSRGKATVLCCDTGGEWPVYECCMWGHHSWSLKGMSAVFKEIFPRCMAMENIRWDVDEYLWPDQPEWIFYFHGCYFVFLCICGNIRNMKCTVIGQADFTLHIIHSYKNKCTV